MRDPYSVLGLDRSASDADIKAAFRAMARMWHPDLHAGDKQAEERFKEAAAANDLLSNPLLRAQYDRGEIAADGARRTPPPRYRAKSSTQDPKLREEAMEILRRAKERREHAQRPPEPEPVRGTDADYRLHISLSEAILGTTKTVTVSGGRSVEVIIPPEAVEGHRVRLTGYGHAGNHGGTAGDAMVEIVIKPHPHFRREGRDVLIDVPITLDEAILGTRLTIPTLTGKVALSIPEGTNGGTVFRLRGKGLPARGGLPAGDQLVEVKLELADPLDASLKAFVKKWTPTGENPRIKRGLES